MSDEVLIICPSCEAWMRCDKLDETLWICEECGYRERRAP